MKYLGTEGGKYLLHGKWYAMVREGT